MASGKTFNHKGTKTQRTSCHSWLAERALDYPEWGLILLILSIDVNKGGKLCRIEAKSFGGRKYARSTEKYGQRFSLRNR